MHIHADYSLQLASLGISREEMREMATRRSAEVRRKLSAASNALGREDEVSAVPARSERQKEQEAAGELDSETFGRLFSVRA